MSAIQCADFGAFFRVYQIKFTGNFFVNGKKQKRWTPKAVKGMAGKNTGYLDPVISAERESIKAAFEKMDKKDGKNKKA